MEEVKDYIFYTILKDFTGNKYKETGISYGIKKGKSINHEDYFYAFLNIDYFPWEGLNLSGDWPNSLEIMSADGNVMIANSAPEVKEFNERTYLIYLPSEPSLFQIIFLELISKEFSDVSIDVGVYGEKNEEFRQKRLNNNFNAHAFLQEYISYHKEKLENGILAKRKVLP